jgi:ATP-dependent Clp protease ATP-binding subunit ClpX
MAAMTPSAIVRYLDQHVIGQDDAKKILAVAVYSHYSKLAKSRSGGIEMGKSNILLIGPTGTGKTLLCETLARGIDVPFVTADATALAQSEYVNHEIDAILQRLIERAGGDIATAQRGIVFIDEVDKLRVMGGSVGERVGGGESVQHALLKIMEGAPVRLGDARYIDTANIMFICGGAFVGLDSIVSKTHSFGFIAAAGGSDDKGILDRLNARVKPTDLFEFGLIQEFTGRLPVIARLEALSKEMLVRSIVEPKNSVYNQFREMLKFENVELRIEPKVFAQVADLAIEYKIGARSLRGIFEEMLTPILYLVPDNPDIRAVTIHSLFEEAVYTRA